MFGALESYDYIMNYQHLKDEIKNHPEQLYRDRDNELRDMMKRWSKDMDGDFRVQAMQIASTLPNANLAELIDNTERIMKWLEERI